MRIAGISIVPLLALFLSACQTGVTAVETGVDEYVVTVSRAAVADPVRYARLEADGRCRIKGQAAFVLEERADTNAAMIRYKCEAMTD